MAAAPPRTVCLSDVFGSLNRGDALLSDALIAAVREAFPEARLTGVAHFPDIEAARHPDIDWQEAPSRCNAPSWRVRRAVNAVRTLLALAYGAMGAPAALAPFYPLPARQLAAIAHLKSADLVVSCPGGFLLDANATILSHLLQFHFMRRFGRRYVLAPQTVGPIRSRLLRRLTARALAGAEMIAVREQYSYDFVVDALGIDPARVVRTTDIAFEYRVEGKAAGRAALMELGIGADEAFIGATTVNWKFRGAPDPAAAYRAYTEKMVVLLTRLHAATGLRIVLFNQVSQDLELARVVAARCASFVVLDEADRTTEEMVGMISRASVMLGSRFHSCVFALLAGVPLFCLAYTYKSTGIMEDLGLSEFVAPIDAFEVEETVARVETLLADRDAACARIDAAVTAMRFPPFSGLLRDLYR
ncbi:MAG: polysaccharide pyruvyl transferase family protein [Pseudomonadota bacterium]